MSSSLAISRFNPDKKELISEYDPLSQEDIDYIISKLKFTDHPIEPAAENISNNYIELLRRDLRHVRLNPNGMENFIQQLQLRIDTSSVKDGIGVGNATASAITATGTQEAFNVKRVTGKRSTIGNNKALDVVKGKRDPTDEGTLIAYFKPPTFAEAYHQVDQLTQRYLSDFIHPRVEIDTAAELNIPDWYHRLATLNNYGTTFEDKIGLGVSDPEDRFEQSQKYIFMRLSLDTDAMYRCDVTPTELVKHIENIKLPKILDARIMAIPAPLLEAHIDVAILEVIKYEPFAQINIDKEVAGERIEQLRYRHILTLIRDAIFGKYSPLLRGIKGVTDVEVNRDNVNDAIDDIYEVPNTRVDYNVTVMPTNWEEYLPNDVDIIVNDKGTLKLLRQVIPNPDNTQESILNPKFATMADSLIDEEFLFRGSLSDEHVLPLRAWQVDIQSFQRIYQSIGVIPILRFLSFYNEVNQQSKNELYLRAYDMLKGTTSVTTSTAILMDPSRYMLSTNRDIPNSSISTLTIYTEQDLNEIRSECIVSSRELTSPEDHNPIFHITHRSYGRIFYNLMHDPNVDIDMSTFSNGIIVASMLGIEAYYAISTYGLRSALGPDINPQHASMFASHRSVTGNPATLTLTARATAGVGPITASQMNPPVATFSRLANKSVGESTRSTVGFMCSTNRESDKFEAKLDAYGRPVVDHFNAKSLTPANLGFEAVVDHKEEKRIINDNLAEFLLNVNRQHVESKVIKTIFAKIKPWVVSDIKAVTNVFRRIKPTGRFVTPSLRKM